MLYQKKPLNKKNILSLLIVLVVAFFNLNSTLAKASTTSATKKTAATKVVSKKKVVKTKKVVKAKKTVKSGKTVMTLKWSADGIKTIGSIAAFDYSYSIRNAVIKKIENYAKRNHIKVITAKVINSMNE